MDRWLRWDLADSIWVHFVRTEDERYKGIMYGTTYGVSVCTNPAQMELAPEN